MCDASREHPDCLHSLTPLQPGLGLPQRFLDLLTLGDILNHHQTSLRGVAALANPRAVQVSPSRGCTAREAHLLGDRNGSLLRQAIQERRYATLRIRMHEISERAAFQLCFVRMQEAPEG